MPSSECRYQGHFESNNCYLPRHLSTFDVTTGASPEHEAIYHYNVKVDGDDTNRNQSNTFYENDGTVDKEQKLKMLYCIISKI
jgi:hypothetical protein